MYLCINCIVLKTCSAKQPKFGFTFDNWDFAMGIAVTYIIIGRQLNPGRQHNLVLVVTSTLGWVQHLSSALHTELQLDGNITLFCISTRVALKRKLLYMCIKIIIVKWFEHQHWYMTWLIASPRYLANSTIAFLMTFWTLNITDTCFNLSKVKAIFH